jgi:DNA-binding response OmpR family regulator
MLERAVAGTDREELSSNAIEQRMSRLRRILDASNSSVRITTVRGSGYMLEAADPKEAQPGISGDHAIASYVEV